MATYEDYAGSGGISDEMLQKLYPATDDYLLARREISMATVCNFILAKHKDELLEIAKLIKKEREEK